jgi:Fe-S-cluster containining protein
MGPFAITKLDATRLRRGLQELETSDPVRAARVRQRSRDAADRLPVPAAGFAGDTEFESWLESLPDDDPCPVLDPKTETCDLYAARPLTCRIFGPPVRWGGEAMGVCELCFQGASDEEIAACEVRLDVAALEAKIGIDGQTLVALALA